MIRATLHPDPSTMTVRSARPLYEPEVDEYTGALTEMGAAAASDRFDGAVSESREALREQIVYLVALYAVGCGPHMRERLALATHDLLDEAVRVRSEVRP